MPLAFFGFALCLLRENTGSLYPCIALHCANNSLAFGVSQHWNWQILVLFVSALGTISLTGLVVRANLDAGACAGDRLPRPAAQRPDCAIGTFPRHMRKRCGLLLSSSSWPRQAPPPRRLARP